MKINDLYHKFISKVLDFCNFERYLPNFVKPLSWILFELKNFMMHLILFIYYSKEEIKILMNEIFFTRNPYSN